MTDIPLVHFETATTLAVNIASHEPLLLLAADQRVIAASASFCRNFEIDPATIPGKKLGEIGHGEWAMPKLQSLLEATTAGAAQIEAYEIDLSRPNHKSLKLLINARTLDDGDVAHIRVLMAVTDVTDAREETRLKDDLVREKAVLLREVQHRVANSLQIIASVLMQSARRTQSEEARGHIQNAHSRVLAIASVQRQLATSDGGSVDIHAYFVQLCKSLATSMIADPDRIKINVNVTKTFVEASVSVSLGLIVTELVINALKHAFVHQQEGLITIAFTATDKDWTLSITDNGCGMANGADAPKAGLGTGIVEALAKNLGGEIAVANANPGTSVTITHREADHVGDILPSAA